MTSEANKKAFRDSLAAGVDKYVKQQGRNTIAINAESDEACAGYARVPGPNACDFCVTMGAASDFYHSEATAGGGAAHGTKDDAYHPYCNCSIVMIFKKRGRHVALDPETGEIVPYNGKELVERYQNAGSPTFRKNRAAEAGRRRARRLHRGTKEEQIRATAAKKEEAARLAEEQAKREAMQFSTEESRMVLSSKELADAIGTDVTAELAKCVEEAMLSGDAARVNAAKLFADDVASGRIRISSTVAEKSRYLPGMREIELTPAGAKSSRTLFHEGAHLRDHQSIVSYSVERMGQDGKVLQEFVVSDANYTTLSYGKEAGGKTLANRLGRASQDGKGDTAAWRDCKRRLGVRSDKEAYDAILARAKEVGLVGEDGSFENIRSLSDFMQAASNGRVDFGYGHWREEKYIKDGVEKTRIVADWDEVKRVIEPWADYDAALLANPAEADLIRELFPIDTGIMDELREVMVR